MFEEKPYINGVMNPKLAEKIESQLTTIATRFVQGKVSVQVIVEGYETFYTQLTNKIEALGHKQFEIISLVSQKSDGWDPINNVTAILVDNAISFACKKIQMFFIIKVCCCFNFFNKRC